jgi:hypothetical protein
MRLFKIKSFSRFCRKEGITDQQLKGALASMSDGLRVASLGGDLFKLRVARKGGGKSGGYRTIVAVRFNHRAIFLFGFAKGDTENIDDADLETAKMLARSAFEASDQAVEQALAEGRWTEVMYDDASF